MKLLLPILAVLILASCSPFQKAMRKHNKLGDRERMAITSMFTDASREKILGNLSKAKDLYEYILTKDPLHDASLYELALILGSEGKTEEAIEKIDLAIKIDPDNKWYEIAKARIYESGGKFSKAAGVYRNLIKKHPAEYDLYILEADAWINANDGNKAIAVYDELEDIQGVSEELCIRRYYIYLMSRQDDKAISELEKLVENFPGNSEYLNVLIEFYMMEGKLNKAFDKIKELQKVDPENGSAHIYLSDYYRAVGRNELANEELMLAIASQNLNVDEKVKLLYKFYETGSVFGDTLFLYRLMDTLTESHPDESKVWAMYADILINNGETKLAIGMWEKSIELDSSKFLVWESLMSALYAEKDYNKLQQYSANAVSLFPEQGLGWFFNGVSYFEKKEYEGAIMPLEMGLDLMYDNKELKAQCLFILAESYHHVKQFEKSDETYLKLFELDAQNYIAINNYAYYSAIRKDNLEDAEKRMLPVVEKFPKNAKFLDTYAYLLFRMGKYEQAEQYMELSLNNGGDKDGTIVEHYGDILFFLGEVENALNQWRTAKELGGTTELIDKKIEDGKYYE